MSKPNILFIMLDQQRLDCIGASGVRPVKTPDIDKLAENGVFFEKAHPHSRLCPYPSKSYFGKTSRKLRLYM